MQTMSTAPQEYTESQHRPGILGRNWYNDKAVPGPSERWATVYNTSYEPYNKTVSSRDRLKTWHEVQGLDAGFASDQSGKKYLGNLATTYGQTHGPPKTGRSDKTSYEDRMMPLQNVANSETNQTGYGLIDSMKTKWFAETSPNRNWQTTYQVQFPKMNARTTTMRAGAMKPAAQYRLEQVLRHMGTKTYSPESNSRSLSLANRPTKNNKALQAPLESLTKGENADHSSDV